MIVGVHDDQTVNRYKGSNFPIMSLHDRVLCVLSNKYVDEVVIGAPWQVTRDLISSFNISIVVQGSFHKGSPEVSFRKGSVDLEEDPYVVSKELGIYREIESTCMFDTHDIIQRIVDNRLRYSNKFEKTSQREINYYSTQRQYVPEV